MVRVSQLPRSFEPFLTPAIDSVSTSCSILLLSPHSRVMHGFITMTAERKQSSRRFHIRIDVEELRERDEGHTEPSGHGFSGDMDLIEAHTLHGDVHDVGDVRGDVDRCYGELEDVGRDVDVDDLPCLQDRVIRELLAMRRWIGSLDTELLAAFAAGRDGRSRKKALGCECVCARFQDRGSIRFWKSQEWSSLLIIIHSNTFCQKLKKWVTGRTRGFASSSPARAFKRSAIVGILQEF
ncbi:hypothetical protein D9757_007905 [Collybiopsis confluens]|uniref:Uncharacterized protein n=1 Tax=Collybiopsis confluens TaxID=2823264 RepID=A0A8H5M5A6_9AGAR|nr:hypothetical protein D9757_007905 [Collybiopsis confluens]